jgi:hypothetical protein
MVGLDWLKELQMNSKTAKRLRKEANFHPSDERSYEQTNQQGTIEVMGDCSRAFYRAMKKRVKNTRKGIFS